MNKFTFALSIIACFYLPSAHSAMIDDFNGGDMEVFATNTASAIYSGAFGGQRTVNIEKAGPFSDFQEAKSKVSDGYYKQSADSFINATGTISWNSSYAIDLTDNNRSSAFALDIQSIDQGNVDLTLSVIDFFNKSDNYTLQGAGMGIQLIAFNFFSGIDFMQITDISLTMTGGESSDITLDSISTVPTPPVFLLLVLGLVTLGLQRRLTA